MSVMNLHPILANSLTTTVTSEVRWLVNSMFDVLLEHYQSLDVYSNVRDEPAPNISKLTNHDSDIGSAVVSELHI